MRHSIPPIRLVDGPVLSANQVDITERDDETTDKLEGISLRIERYDGGWLQVSVNQTRLPSRV